MIGDTTEDTTDVSNVSDFSDSSTQLVESNVAALENMSDESVSTVRERVASWLESASESSIDFGIDCGNRRERSFSVRLFHSLGFRSTAKSECLWQEPHVSWRQRCESSYSELSDIE
jgi:hypothetical protein